MAKLTEHSIESWKSRFGGSISDMRKSLNKAVEFGPEVKGCKYLLDDSIEAVFVKSPNDYIMTVLPKDYAIANIESNSLFRFEVGINDQEKRDSKLKQLAKEMFEKYGPSAYSCKVTRKQINKELRELGYDPGEDNLGTYFKKLIEELLVEYYNNLRKNKQ